MKNTAFVLRILSLVTTAVCVAACVPRGHTTLPLETRTEIVSHYLRGESLGDLASEYHLDGREDAREVVHQALLTLTRRYYRDR